MDAFGEEGVGAADLGRARQERQHRAGIGTQSGGDGVGHLPLDLGVRLAAEVARLDGVGAAEAFNHRRVAEQHGDARAVDGRRHHEDAQVLAQADLRVAGQRQPHVGVQRTLVEFVEQHGGHAGQFGVVDDLAREDTLGDDLDAGVARDLRAEADAVADGVADALAERLRHPFGAGAGGDAPRLQHDDLFALQPRRIQQRQRHPRGLAGARRRHQHRGIAARQRLRDVAEHVVDREGRVEGAGQWLMLSRGFGRLSAGTAAGQKR